MKNTVSIDPKALEAIKNYTPGEVSGFGKAHSPIMVVGYYRNGAWQTPTLLPYGPLQMDPCCKVLHYGQEIFEGMKAYKVGSPTPLLFRPDANCKRLNVSAVRLGIPPLPEDYFFSAVKTFVAYSESFIPKKSGQSLYVRPFIFADEAQLGVQPSATYCFIVLGSPSDNYFSGEVEVMIERKVIRAFPGGTGNVKAGGNYAASMFSAHKAKERGYQQVLWLDSHDKKNIEELSGMNFFAVINGQLHTPSLTDTILPGITRDSILKLAPLLELKAVEVQMDINQLIKHIKDGTCTEAFACGTASIVSPIKSLGEDSGERYNFPHSYGPITRKIRDTLLDIQEGRKKGPAADWSVAVSKADL